MSSKKINVWGSEDGDEWGAEGHHTLEVMARAIEALEVELIGQDVYNEEYRDGVESGHVSYWWYVDDYHDEERVVLIKGWWRVLGARLFLGARPGTSLYAGAGMGIG